MRSRDFPGSAEVCGGVYGVRLTKGNPEDTHRRTGKREGAEAKFYHLHSLGLIFVVPSATVRTLFDT